TSHSPGSILQTPQFSPVQCWRQNLLVVRQSCCSEPAEATGGVSVLLPPSTLFLSPLFCLEPVRLPCCLSYNPLCAALYMASLATSLATKSLSFHHRQLAPGNLAS